MPHMPRARRRWQLMSLHTNLVLPAYAIKAVRAASPGDEGEGAGRLECRWQRDQLPDVIRELVLDDQRVRNEICWSLFEC